MYMRESRREVPVTPAPLALRVALAICLFATLYLGLFPSRVLQYAQDSAQQIIPQTSPGVTSSARVHAASETF